MGDANHWLPLTSSISHLASRANIHFSTDTRTIVIPVIVRTSGGGRHCRFRRSGAGRALGGGRSRDLSCDGCQRRACDVRNPHFLSPGATPWLGHVAVNPPAYRPVTVTTSSLTSSVDGGNLFESSRTSKIAIPSGL